MIPSKNNIPWATFATFLLSYLLVVPCHVISQNSKAVPHFLFDIVCEMPTKIEAENEIAVSFEVSKADGYVGPMTIVQKLPKGFSLLTEDLPYAKISKDGHQLKIFWKDLPPGNTFSFELKIGIGKISPAAYPFNGVAYFFGFSVNYSKVLIVSSSAKNTSNHSEGHLGPVQIGFTLPEKIVAGREFTFVTELIKESNYVASGKLVQRWPKVFLPMPYNLQNAKSTVANNDVEISWDRLEQGESISVAYQVKVKESAHGLYPVITNFTDENGLKLIESKGILVVTDEPVKNDLPGKKIENIYALRLENQMEVRQGNDFDLSVIFKKGDNAYPGDLVLNLPPGCNATLVEGDNVAYSQISNALILSWGQLPASPFFEVLITLNTEKANKAAYLITADFMIKNKSVASAESHILIADENQLLAMKKTELDAQMTAQVDTTEMFSKMDSLLSEWQVSTGGLKKTGPAEKQFIGDDYRIQILASKTELPGIKKLLRSMEINETYDEHFDGEYFRYNVGIFKSREECADYLKFLQAKGFSDAFIKKYIDGEPEE